VNGASAVQQVPAATPVTINARLAGVLIGTVLVADYCANRPTSMAVSNLPSAATLTVTVTQACAENPSQTVPVPSADVIVQPTRAGSAPLFGTTGSNGQVTIGGLVQGDVVSVTVSRFNAPVGSAVATLAAASNSVTIASAPSCQITGAGGG
jgi:hypothetical protein